MQHNARISKSRKFLKDNLLQIKGNEWINILEMRMIKECITLNKVIQLGWRE